MQPTCGRCAAEAGRLLAAGVEGRGGAGVLRGLVLVVVAALAWGCRVGVCVHVCACVCEHACACMCVCA